MRNFMTPMNKIICGIEFIKFLGGSIDENGDDSFFKN